jgi:hypothetical protein
VSAVTTIDDIKHRVRRRARLALLLRESAARAFRWVAIGFGTLVDPGRRRVDAVAGHLGFRCWSSG